MFLFSDYAESSKRCLMIYTEQNDTILIQIDNATGQNVIKASDEFLANMNFIYKKYCAYVNKFKPAAVPNENDPLDIRKNKVLNIHFFKKLFKKYVFIFYFFFVISIRFKGLV